MNQKSLRDHVFHYLAGIRGYRKMTCYVDIAVEFKGGMRGSGRASIVIWAMKAGQRHETGPYTVTVENETRNRLAIMAVNEALKHFTRPGQEIIIRMREAYVKANLQYLDGWHEKDYKKAGGKTVANSDEWRKLWMLKQSQNISVEIVENAAV